MKFESFHVDNNVASYYQLPSNQTNGASYLACVYKSAGTSSISGNYLYTEAGEGCQWTIVHSKSVVEAGDGNSRNPEAKPYASEDVAQGYFPIDESVVTNGAGADYDTKYWVQK